MKKLVLTAALILAACSGGADRGVEISDAYVFEPMKGRPMTAGYFSATNTGEPTRIVSASSPVANRIELHTHLTEDGVMKMRQVDGVDLATGETVTFQPGGLHLMIFGIELEEGTTEIPVTLGYDNGEEVTLIVPVRSR